MASAISPRLLAAVDALPLASGIRVLEVGGAPGAAAREVADRVGPTGHVLVVDRSRTGIDRTRRYCSAYLDEGIMSTACASIEEFSLSADAEAFDIAFACRVGALDGRHPELRDAAVRNIRAALKPEGRLFVDTGDPLREIPTR